MKTFFAALLTLFVATTAAAQSLTVAAASDLQPVLPEIAKRFEKEMKIPVRTTFGSSGNFFAQIENGAPFDLFLSADVEYPGRLEDDGLPSEARGLNTRSAASCSGPGKTATST